MQRMIPVERLAREDRMVLVRARKARKIREEQNLDDRVTPFDEEALRARMHGIFLRRGAGDGSGRPHAV